MECSLKKKLYKIHTPTENGWKTKNYSKIWKPLTVKLQY